MNVDGSSTDKIDNKFLMPDNLLIDGNMLG